MTTGLVVGFGIGVGSRLLGIPSPAPQALTGALLVLAITTGYLVMGRWIDRTGKPRSADQENPQ